jgi:hypothetical protein
MKLTVLFILIFSFFNVYGQSMDNRKNIVIVESAKTSITQKEVDDYTNFNEWHFELRLNPEQRQKYQAFLIDDLKKGKLVDDVYTKSVFMDEFKKKGWMELYSTHSDLKNTDNIELATQDTLNGKGSETYVDPLIELYGGKKPDKNAKPAEEKIYGTGIYANLRRWAKNDKGSSAYLLGIIKDYQKALIGDGSYKTSLFRKDIDATFEWLSFRMVIVAGKKVVEGNSEERALMEQRIIKTWKDLQSDRNKLSKYKEWLDSNVSEWLIWRGGEYSFFARQTPFGKKEQLAKWGNEILGVSPQMRPFVEQRIKEYKDYVAKMPNEEIKKEFEIKQKTNTEFAIRMQKMQNDMKSTQQTFAVMRQGLMNLHVANLNIAENIGNTGFTWQIRSQP